MEGALWDNVPPQAGDTAELSWLLPHQLPPQPGQVFQIPCEAEQEQYPTGSQSHRRNWIGKDL